MEIIETQFRVDRFYVVIKEGQKQYTIPRANFVWLQGNPGFKTIPKGYVIHHLDHDKTNDDISNLAIMQKYHHVSHHWKQKTIDNPIILKGEENVFYFPIKRPKVRMDAKTKRFYVELTELDGEGKKNRLRIYRKQMKAFIFKEDAEKYADQLWEAENANTANVPLRNKAP